MDSKSLNRRQILGAAIGSLAGAALLAGCSAAAPSSSGGSANGQPITLYVFRGETGIKGPDGKGHDAVVPSSFVVKSGIPVALTMINYDEGPHTITAPDLKLNIVINPGKVVGDNVEPVTSTATFTPSTKGVFRWSCTTACDAGGGGWAMTADFAGPAQDGFMAGSIVVM